MENLRHRARNQRLGIKTVFVAKTMTEMFLGICCFYSLWPKAYTFIQLSQSIPRSPRGGVWDKVHIGDNHFPDKDRDGSEVQIQLFDSAVSTLQPGKALPSVSL